MNVTDCAQTVTGLLSGQITLGFRQHFIPDHKLAHRRRTQQWRIKMRMQLPMAVVLFDKGRAVPSHGIGERAFEQIVVPAGELLQRYRQIGALRGIQSIQAQYVGFGQQ